MIPVRFITDRAVQSKTTVWLLQVVPHSTAEDQLPLLMVLQTEHQQAVFLYPIAELQLAARTR
jgi:hypothetical protein